MSGTERPWHVDGVFIVNAEDRIVTKMPGNMARYDAGRCERALADAELIVRAVNAHDDLVAALKALVQDADCDLNREKGDGFRDVAVENVERGRAALATATSAKLP